MPYSIERPPAAEKTPSGRGKSFQPASAVSDLRPLPDWQRYLPVATWAMVALGVALRLARYLLRFPLWGDEVMVAANFLDRGYADLVRPLDYSQICPLLFLWMELAMVKLWGFHELALRLIPTMCSVASVFVFRALAARILRSLPLLLAVGVFAVSYYPIRHGAEVKPYAGDLLIAVVLLWMAVRWLHQPERPVWLWAMAAVAPLCLGISLTAVFVAGGVSVALAVPVWRRKERATWLAYLAFNAAVAVAFVGLYVAYLRPLFSASGADVGRSFWSDSFPPLAEPRKLLAWFLTTHAGRMLAYPNGGEHGGSSLTALLCVIALGTLCRRRMTDILLRRNHVLAICLLPFAFGLVAAALQKYPYGQSARTMQYVAPAVCLLFGLGMATVVGWARRPQIVGRLGAGVALTLGMLGSGQLAYDLLHPYKTAYDQSSREFARWFWNAQAQDAHVLCATTDLGLDFRVGRGFPQSPDYLCHQRMFRQREATALPENDRFDGRPVRVVMHWKEGECLDAAAVEQWRRTFEARFALALGGVSEFRVNPGVRAGQGDPFGRLYRVYEFRPYPQ